MKCLKCGNEMNIIEQNVSFRSDEKEYEKITYNCNKDDIWIVVETPKDRAN